MKLSAIILTHNNEKQIRKCLASVSFADEIILIDDHSTDQTLRMAKKFKPIVYTRRLKKDYKAQRNFGLKKASGDWILFLDSDEIVTSKLKQEILKAINQTDMNGFYLKRQDIFLGKTLHYGETGKIKLLRLAQKNSGKWQRSVHETWKIEGKTSILKNPLLHERNFLYSQFLEKINLYTSIDAKELITEKKFFSYPDLFFKPIGKFFYNYFYLLGFMDGFPGFVMAISMSLHSLIVRVKLYEHKNKS